MAKIDVKILCKYCDGLGYKTRLVIVDGVPNGTEQVTCDKCSGEKFVVWGKVEKEFYDDIMDKLNDILDKCNDIFEKVNE